MAFSEVTAGGHGSEAERSAAVISRLIFFARNLQLIAQIPSPLLFHQEMTMRAIIVFLCAVAATGSGCASIHTTMMSRASNDSLYKDPCQKKCLKGVPVKLKVPTHLCVRIVEDQILITGTNESKLVSFSQPQMRVVTSLEYTDKVFLVDFRRPAAGTLAMLGENNASGIGFDADQYFGHLNAKIDDTTIRDVTSVISKFPNAATAATPTANVRLPDVAGVQVRESLIAYERFDIAEPDCEERVQCFINYYVNPGTCPTALSEVPVIEAPNEFPVLQ